LVPEPPLHLNLIRAVLPLPRHSISNVQIATCMEG
jgi:hypothetical protein